MKAYIQTKQRRADGTYDCYQTHCVPCREAPKPRKGQTQSGYGRALPTPYMVQWQGRWRRVKVCQYSNAGTAYIGLRGAYDPCLIVSEIDLGE